MSHNIWIYTYTSYTFLGMFSFKMSGSSNAKWCERQALFTGLLLIWIHSSQYVDVYWHFAFQETSSPSHRNGVFYFRVLNYKFYHKNLVRPTFYLDHISLQEKIHNHLELLMLFLCHFYCSSWPFLLACKTSMIGSQPKKCGPERIEPELKVVAGWNSTDCHTFLSIVLSLHKHQNYLNCFTQSKIVTTFWKNLALVVGSLGWCSFIGICCT